MDQFQRIVISSLILLIAGPIYEIDCYAESKLGIEDETRIEFYLSRARQSHPNWDRSLFYTNKALLLAKQKNASRQIIDCYNELGIIHWKKGNLETSRYFLNEAIELSNSTFYKNGLGNAYLTLGRLSKFIGDDNMAREQLLTSVGVFTSIEKFSRLSSAYNNLALLEKRTGDYEKAMEYFIRSANLAQISRSDTLLLKLYNNIANLFFRVDDFEKALKYYHNAVVIAQQYDLKYHLTGLYFNLGGIHFGQKKFDSAKYYFNKVHQSGIAVEPRYPPDLQYYLSHIFRVNKDTLKALMCADSAIAFANARNLHTGKYLEKKAELLYELGYSDSAKYYYQKSLNLLINENENASPHHRIKEAYLLLLLDQYEASIMIIESVFQEFDLSDFDKQRCYEIIIRALTNTKEADRISYYTENHKKLSAKISKERQFIRIAFRNLETCCLKKSIKQADVVDAISLQTWMVLAASIIIVLISVFLFQKRTEKMEIGFTESAVVLSEDEKFLQRAFQILDVSATDSSFSVNTFIREIGISRSQLHRKLKGLTGLSASAFIRDYRLVRAYEMIKKGRRNIAQVAYDSGFNTPSYFSECFKKKYNVLPKDVRSPRNKSSLIRRFLVFPISFFN